MNNTLRAIVAVLGCEAAGLIGGVFTSSSIPTWYAALHKPSWNPPNWLFGPVWTTLYLMMGIAVFLVWKTDLKTVAYKQALLLFIAQLVLNVLWSILFFGLRSPFMAFLEIIVLWALILLTIVSFYPISKTASYLMIPYILWVSFAAVLNLAIYLLNR